jgi:PhoPQ-activated pathogenicity-related protein
MLYKFLIALLLCVHCSCAATPLDDYMIVPDPHYSWSVENVVERSNAKIYTLALTSQKWRSAEEVNEPIWRHRLTIIVPNELKTRKAILSIAGGNIQQQPSLEGLEMLFHLSHKLKAIVCEITMIPNQPLKFVDESDVRYIEQGRREDALVAYTWDKFLKNEESDWLLRLPMTKAVVRGMDAIEEFLDQKLELSTDGFYVLGISKRGWTAWCAAAVDSRVQGVIPIVIDLLNLKASFIRQYMAYGGWSFAVRDYADINLPNRWNNTVFDRMMSIIEPFAYLDRFTMPKFLINATGDEFFLPDSSQLYYDALQGQKHLLYLPNSGHRVNPAAFSESLIAYLKFQFSEKSLPAYSWQLTPQNRLKVEASEKPIAVNLWKATNPTARDFRVTTIGNSWMSTPVQMNDAGEYEVELVAPENGWSGYFIELIFKSPGEELLKVTTSVFVAPDIYPFSMENL